MTLDLWMLAGTAVLCLALPFPALIGVNLAPGGKEYALGNRDQDIELAAWVGRAQRAHANLVENIGPFAAIVLVVHVSGHANDITGYGAAAFLALRLLHAIIYIGGVTGVRTAIFVASLAAEFTIASQLLT